MFLNVLFGIFYLLAVIAAGAGVLGTYNLFLTDYRRPKIGKVGHVCVWLISVCALAALISIAATNEWGPFDPDSCSRSRPCVRVIQGQP